MTYNEFDGTLNLAQSQSNPRPVFFAALYLILDPSLLIYGRRVTVVSLLLFMFYYVCQRVVCVW